MANASCAEASAKRGSWPRRSLSPAFAERAISWVLALALFDHGAAELRESDVPVRERAAGSQGWSGPEGKLPVPGAVLGR